MQKPPPPEPKQPLLGESTTEVAGYSKKPSSSSMNFSHLCIGLALIALSFGTTVGTVLWPMFVKDHFGWAHTEYAWAIVVSSIVGTLFLASYPTVAARIGSVSATAMASLVGLAVSVIAFNVSTTYIAAVLQVGLMTCFLGITSFLEPALKSIASIRIPQQSQGTSFGIMQSLAGIGRTLGNIVGTQLYHYSKTHGSGFGANGVLPMYAAGASLAVVAIATVISDQLATSTTTKPPVGSALAPLPHELDMKHR